MHRDDAIHDWAVTGEESHRKCRKCGVHEWYFSCLMQWRRDIPRNMQKYLPTSFNQKGKFKWVSESWPYRRMEPQPTLPIYRGENGLQR